MQKDLTQGSVGKNLILFSLPFLLSYFLQTFYGLADLFIIGQFNGAEVTTAVSVGSQLMHMVTVIIEVHAFLYSGEVFMDCGLDD